MLNLESFKSALKRICPEAEKQKFLLAISGGADSMVLLHFFKISNLDFEVAHINYHLRGEESIKDQKLVEKYCKKNSVPLHIYIVSEDDLQPKNSIQEWARNLRYTFFKQILEERNLNFIVTAHHLNDELETFIINLSKASGIKGLSGIPTNENKILRPLLDFSKEDIYKSAKLNDIEFREDLSNQKNDYLRNKIRNEVVPHLMQVNENFLSNFGKSISYLQQTNQFVQEQIHFIENETITQKDSYFLVAKEKFFTQSQFVQVEMLRKFGFNSSVELEKLQNAAVGKIYKSVSHQMTVDREFLIIKELKVVQVDEVEIHLEINNLGEILIPENIHQEISVLGKVNWKIGKENIHLPLKLRTKKEGEVFYPLGMVGKKKISKFIKDEKISLLLQEKVFLLCDAEDQILGVLPLRQDRRFLPKGDEPFHRILLA
ncbi:tRNA lysidine(34) synthetase TilS [Chryseobacterium sp. MP_3.2]|uniref:tRNA lysidine(34) synthetase TilS n=1 Tax=Chryseobacterium sp. MP_3.2 TaxID=3071712 RepID=UPI002DFBDEA2|nr:tRNA(Ile)-lysidine synthase [Chryseobacterium sp. MP_3.2]